MSDVSFIRDTYAFYERHGIPNDGLAHGVEHTRYREAVPPWEEELPTPLPEREPAAADRYGFFDTSTQARSGEIALARKVYLHRRVFVRPRQVRTPRGRVREPSVQHVQMVHKYMEPVNEVRELRRTKKWYGMVDEDKRQISSDVRDDVLSRRVFKGIPDEMRGIAWDALAAAMAAKTNTARSLPSLSELMCQDSPSDIQIDLDVPRTVRGHERFYTRYGRGQCELFRVLHAMSLVCPESNYCQGMGPAAAMLLMHMPPDRAFLVLVRMHDAYAFRELYRPGFPGLRENFFVLTKLLDLCVPRLAKVLRDHNIAPSAYATRWIITLFHGVLPHTSQLRVWDVFFLCGQDALLVVAVGILRALDMEGYAARVDNLLEHLGAYYIPELDDAIMSWVRAALMHNGVQACIRSARHAWSQLVDNGQASDVFV